MVAHVVDAVVVIRSVGSCVALRWDAEGVRCCGCSTAWCGGGKVLPPSRVTVRAAVTLKG
eukprot:8372281-Pyramimonas_sp.AAC.1